MAIKVEQASACSGQAPARTIATLALLLLSACSNAPPRAASLGEAYVGPAELKIRADIPMESATVATVHHGDRLQILQQRRSVFLRVRVPNGAEGWTDARQLLGARDMAGLRALAARAAQMPSQGVATTYGALPVHTEPTSDSPAFLSIKEGEKFEVLAHQVMPRVSAPRPPLVAAAPKPAKPNPRKTSKAGKLPPLPMPKPPGPPPNWIELSQPAAGDAETAPPPEQPAEKIAPTDDWSLVRTSSGQSGWVLTRRLWMAIPDDVAQYAEGHRIVSYLPLGEVRDGDEVKQQWIWTTIEGSSRPDYDFDSFRVFVWSLRRHRYETAYIERNIRGHSPVLLRQVDLSNGSRKTPGPATAYPGFSICEEKADGQRRRREFAFLNPTVRFAGDRECEGPQSLALPLPAPAPSSAAAPAASKTESMAQRVKRKWSALTKRWFSR